MTSFAHNSAVSPIGYRLARVRGVVILEVLIDENGDVQDARILRSIPLLNQAVLDAVRQWTFAPTLGPEPVSRVITQI